MRQRKTIEGSIIALALMLAATTGWSQAAPAAEQGTGQQQAQQQRTAQDIQARIQQQVTRELGQAQGLNVEVQNGQAVLTGEVDNYFQKMRAGQLASSTRGVDDVHNNITVRQGGDNEQLQQQVQQRLQGFGGGQVQAEVQEGTVTLKGNVASEGQKEQAERMIVGLRGIRDVKNELEVAPHGMVVDRAHQERFYALVNRLHEKDKPLSEEEREELTKHLKDALQRDPSVGKTDIDVKIADDNSVELTGQVNNYAASRQAHEMISQLGFAQVRNNIKVEGAMTTSEAGTTELQKEQLNDIFKEDAVLAGSNVDFNEENGVITLEGEVNSDYQRRYVEEIVSNRVSVTQVQNNIKVKAPEDLPENDEDLVKAVERQFFWSVNVDGGDINVGAQNGVVTLSGQVDSLDEFNAATANAVQAGAKQVINHLVIQPMGDSGQGGGVRDRFWFGSGIDDGGAVGTDTVEDRQDTRQGLGRSPSGAISGSGTGSVDTGSYNPSVQAADDDQATPTPVTGDTGAAVSGTPVQ